jgi:uncharacterized membrane protein YkoI
MKSLVLTAAVLAAFALPAGAQMTTTAGQVQPTSGAVKVEITVKPTLASTARISADSAFAIARSKADNGEVSSAKLGTRDGRLVYMVEVLNKSKRETSVVINAIDGRVLEATQHGGVKATRKHARENKKLKDAKKDSLKTAP